MMNNTAIPTLQIPGSQIQGNNQGSQVPLNLNMNIPSLPQYPANMQYVYPCPLIVNAHQYALLQLQQQIQQNQQIQLQMQLQQMLPNANNAYPAPQLVFIPQPLNKVFIPNQSLNCVPNMQHMQNMANVPLISPAAVYPSQSKQSSLNMNMNMKNVTKKSVHSNMSRTTLSSPPSTNSYQNSMNINNSAVQPQLHANSRGNSPRLSPKLSPISENSTFDDSDDQYLSPSYVSPPASPSLTPLMPHFEAEKMNLVQFKFPPRAQLNIYIGKNLTKTLLDVIYEQFPNSERLYYYLDISTALQINDEQMHIFKYKDNYNGETVQIIFVNYDLHCKESGDLLYGFVTANKAHIANKKHTVNQNKWMWKLDEFMTAAEIENKFGIKQSDLPKSSRMTPKFQNELKVQSECIKNISADIIDDTDWFNIQQIKSLRRDNKRNKKYLQFVAKVNESRWIEQCKQVFNDAVAIPIVVKNKTGSNKHWIEWVKLISTEDDNGNKLYVGVSCKYCDSNNKWEIKSICLDKGDIENKHRLVGLTEHEKARYLSNFENFHTTIAEIQWIRSK